MKKRLFIWIIVIILGIVGAICLYNYLKPIDSTKQLYISCGNISSKYDTYVKDRILFAEENDSCKLDLFVEDIQDNSIQLRSTNYFFQKNGRGSIDDFSLSYTLTVLASDTLILVGHDKKTVFEFKFR